MNISGPFIRRPVMTSLIMLAIVIFGITSYRLLPVASIPTIAFPTIQVSVNYPGASPDTMARLVAGPLERQFILMEGVEVIASNNTYESTTIICQFHMNIDIDVGASEVEEAITQAQAYLPSDLPSLPTYTKSNPSDTPILYLVVTSNTMTDANLYKYGYNLIGQQIGTVNGVANIQIFGYPYAVRVKVDPGQLAAKNISLEDLANAINDNNPDQPTGKFYNKYHGVTNLTHGQMYTPEEYNNLIIKYADNGPVRIRDIGLAEASLQNDRQAFKWYTKEGVEGVMVLAIFKANGYNTVNVCDNIVSLVERLKKDLPQSMTLQIPYNQAIWIREAVADVQNTLLVAFGLVILVVFFYLGKFRNSIIPLITLPITLTGTFIVMLWFNYSIDILSLSAFTLAIGFLVDDAIVVLENIVRWVQSGENPYQGALKGSKQISVTIFSISLCLCAVFIPLLFMSGVVGEIFHEFSAVIIISVLFSGFISLTLTPMLCSRFVPPYKQEEHPFLERVSLRLNELMLNAYKKPLLWALDHKFIMLIIALASLGASLYIFVTIPRSFLPPNDIGIIQCFAQTDENSSPENMERYLDKISEICIKNKYVETIASINGYPTDNQAIFFVNLVDMEKRPSIWDVIGNLEKEIYEEVIGADVFMKAYPLINLQVGNVESGKANYQYVMTSFDEDLLYKTAEELYFKLLGEDSLAHVSSDMQVNSTYLDINIRRDEAQAYSKIDASKVESTLQYAYGESYISKMNLPENMYYVIVELADKFDESPQDLNQLYVVQDGEPIAIKNVIDTQFSAGPSTINHINTLTSVTFSFDSAPDVALSTAVANLLQIAQETLPEGIDGGLAGNTAAFQQSNRQLMYLLILAIFVIYLILGVLYENFLLPITPLSAVPIASVGGLATLLLFGESLSVYAFVGLIMLLGIVMKNGIIVVDFALEQMRDFGKNAHDAAYEACVLRFRPIVMTTFAAMMGAVPIALGIGGTVAEGRSPLGMVIVGGLLFSQLVTLFVTPVIFIYLCHFQEWVFTKTIFFRSHEEPPSLNSQPPPEGGNV